MIKFKDVQIGYSTPLIQITDLTLETSTLYILAGKNGTGKSTLLKSISRQIRLLSGRITINGEQLKNVNISKQVSFVKSTFPSVDYLKTNEYIALGRTPHTNAFGRLTKTDQTIIQNAIEQLNIQHLADKYTSELSDGERQLVSIARALVQETPIIILDEPTAFLDYSNKLTVLNKLKDIAAELNKCILLSSHDIDLCLEAKCPFILLNRENKSVQQLQPPINKKELLAIGFSYP